MEILPIAYIRTDLPDKFGIPRQSGLVPALRGEIEFLPAFSQTAALRGLDAFSHVWLIWGFSASQKEEGARPGSAAIRASACLRQDPPSGRIRWGSPA